MASAATSFKQSTALNRDYIIRYFPDSNDRHNNQLIGKKRLYEILRDYRTRRSVFNRIMANTDDILEIKLRRGIMFRFSSR